MLRDTLAVVQFARIRDNSKSLQIIDIKSEKGVHAEALEPPSFVYAAKNGYIYMLEQSPITESGELPNPTIIVYKYMK